MPEGHTIHRLARDLGRDLGNDAVAASSPQGRFVDSAVLIDGAVAERSEAFGKHLFVSWSTGDILHIHLGLIGKFRRHPAESPSGDTIRLRLETNTSAWHLTGPQTCALITPEEQELVTSKLGPDPLRRGSKRRGEFVSRLLATRRPVGAALLDQGIVAGIGNVYRAELLLLAGVHPQRPAADLGPELAGRIWDLTVDQLKRGLAWNRIVTVTDRDIGRRVTRRIDSEDALFVYHRGDEPCRRCNTPIEDRTVASRSIWFCPTCQPE